MSLYVSDFLDSRIDDIIKNLRETNGEYAIAVEKCKGLHENIDPIVYREEDITISGGDCMDFKGLFEHEFNMTAIMQQELYKQGYVDCIKLLKMLEIFI